MVDVGLGLVEVVFWIDVLFEVLKVIKVVVLSLCVGVGIVINVDIL